MAPTPKILEEENILMILINSVKQNLQPKRKC